LAPAVVDNALFFFMMTDGINFRMRKRRSLLEQIKKKKMTHLFTQCFFSL